MKLLRPGGKLPGLFLGTDFKLASKEASALEGGRYKCPLAQAAD
jgi:hypothetical protein